MRLMANAIALSAKFRMSSGGSDSGETRRTHPFARHGYQTAINANAKETTHGTGPRQSDFGEIPIAH